MNRKIYDACEYVKNLRFLSKTAMELVEFTPGKDIYKFRGIKVKKLTGDPVVVVNSFDKEKNSLHPQNYRDWKTRKQGC